MAALSKRDIEMIFRAETDAATRPVGTLASDVKKLRQTLEDLTKAGGKTEGALEGLAATTRDLNKAQEELGTARTLLTQLNAQASAVDRAQAALDKAQTKYDEIKTKIESVEKPTKRLTQQFDTATKRLAATTQGVEDAKKVYDEVKTSIESIIGPVTSIQDSFRAVAVAQREVATGLNQASAAAEQFKADIADAGKAAEEASKFKGMAAVSSVSPEVIAEISQYANRIELLRLEERTLEAQRKSDAMAEAARKQKQKDDIDAVLAGNKALADEIAALEQAQKNAAAIDAYRNIAQEAAQAATSVDRIAKATAEGVPPAQRLADAILAIVHPAAAANTTLDGLNEKTKAVTDALAGGGKRTAAEWNNINNELLGVQAGLLRLAKLADDYTAQEAQVAAAAKAYDEQAAKVRALGAQEAATAAQAEELTSAIKREQKQLESLGGTLDKETAKMNALKDAVKASGGDTNNIGGFIEGLKKAAEDAAPAMEEARKAVSPDGRKGFLGLEPHQLQNLSYQINDVFTSLASGIPITQVIAQQGGQILQLFPGLGAAFVKFGLILGPVVVALGVVAAAMKQAYDQSQLLQTAQTNLAVLGNTNGWDAKKYVAVANAFKAIGVSADDAAAATKAFVTNGLNPKAVDDYVVAAKNLADVQGIDVKDAAEQLTTAFTGNADSVIALDDKYHFLTNTQREHLISTKDTKDEYKAVTDAFSILYKKLQDGANANKGPFTMATNTLRAAWNKLLDAFSNDGPLNFISQWVSDVTLGFAYFINIVRRGLAIFKGVDLTALMNPITGALESLKIAKNLEASGGLSGIVSGARADTIAQMKTVSAPTAQKQTSTADAGSGSATRQKLKEKQDEKDRKQAEKDAKKAAKEAAAEAKKRQREAEALAKQSENEQDQLTSALSRFTAQALNNTEAPLQQQLDNAKQAVEEQFKSLEDRLAEFKAKFGASATINGKTQAQYSADLEAQKQALINQKQLQVYESNINDLIKSRDTQLKDIQQKQESGLYTAQEALDATKEVTSKLGPQIDGAIESARQFIATLSPSSATQALLDKFALIQAQGTGGSSSNQTIIRKQAEASLAQQEKEINNLIEQRTTLIDAANKLYDIGAINYTEKEARIKQAYADTNSKIKERIDQMKAFLEANKDLFPADVYAKALASLEGYKAGLNELNTLQQTVRDTAINSLANGITTAFNSMAESIGQAIMGGKSFGQVLSDLGSAALSFAANFAQAIAQAIIQIYALRIAKSLVGGFHGGGTVGDLGGGQMKLARNIGGPDLNLSAVPRYHNGTPGAGLKHDEMLAVLQKGEKVQTEEQQRLEANRLAAAKKGGSGSLRQVLAFGDEEIAGAMSGPAGENTTITHIRRNRTLLRQELGIK